MMAAPKGNEFWKARTSHGRGMLFDSPEILMDACAEYFQWNHDNPLYARKGYAYQGEITHDDEPRMRAMSVNGLCIFLGISVQTWHDYRQRDDFIEVCAWAEGVIFNQKFEGASADLLNPAIIARDLGLADKKELTGAGGGPIEMDHTERASRIESILERGLERAAGEEDGK